MSLNINNILLDEFLGNGNTLYKLTGPRYTLDNSDIYYLECDKYSMPMAVKLCKLAGRSEPNREEAIIQYKALQEVYRKMVLDPRYCVPRPIALLEKHGIFICEWVQGKSLTEQIMGIRASQKEMLDMLQRAGKWLKLFHQANMVGAGTLDVEKRMKTVYQFRNDCHKDTLFDNAISMMEETAVKAGQYEIPKSWLHGDFKTDNLLMSDNRTVGLDMDIRYENSGLYDVAAFINRFELTLYHPKAIRHIFSRQTYINSFLNGYMNESRERYIFPLTWIRLYSILSLWAGYMEKQHNVMKKIYMQHSFHQVTKRIMHSIKQN